MTFSWIFQPRRQSFSDFIATITELNWRNDAIYLLQGFWKAVEYRKTKQLGIAHEQSVIALVESSFGVYVVKTVWSLLHLSDNMTFLAFYHISVVFFYSWPSLAIQITLTFPVFHHLYCRSPGYLVHIQRCYPTFNIVSNFCYLFILLGMVSNVNSRWHWMAVSVLKCR